MLWQFPVCAGEMGARIERGQWELAGPAGEGNTRNNREAGAAHRTSFSYDVCPPIYFAWLLCLHGNEQQAVPWWVVCRGLADPPPPPPQQGKLENVPHNTFFFQTHLT